MSEKESGIQSVPGTQGTTQAHTPGPWTLMERYEDALSIVDPDGFEHVTAESHAILLGYAEKLGIPHWADSPEAQRDIPEAQQFANARLIAAAPELLSELKDTGDLCAALAVAAMHPALADYLPFGLRERVEGWLVNSRNQDVIRKAEGR
jgi:hypothetical protein